MPLVFIVVRVIGLVTFVVIEHPWVLGFLLQLSRVVVPFLFEGRDIFRLLVLVLMPVGWLVMPVILLAAGEVGIRGRGTASGLLIFIVVVVIVWLLWLVVLAFSTCLVVPVLGVGRLLPLVVLILLIVLIFLLKICSHMLNWQNVLLRQPHRRKLNRYP